MQSSSIQLFSIAVSILQVSHFCIWQWIIQQWATPFCKHHITSYIILRVNTLYGFSHLFFLHLKFGVQFVFVLFFILHLLFHVDELNWWNWYITKCFRNCGNPDSPPHLSIPIHSKNSTDRWRRMHGVYEVFFYCKWTTVYDYTWTKGIEWL